MARMGNEGLLLPLAFGVGTCSILSVAGLAVEWYEQEHMDDAQVAEIRDNPAVFAVTWPDNQPAGKPVATWDWDNGEGASHYTVKFDGSTFSMSDRDQSYVIEGRRSAPIVACSSLAVKEAYSHKFEFDGTSYKAIVTRMGNAAVCAVNR